MTSTKPEGRLADIEDANSDLLDDDLEVIVNLVEGPADPAHGVNYARLLPNDIVFVPREYECDIEGIVEKLVTTGLPGSLQSQPGPSAQDETVRRVTLQTLR